MKVSLTPSRLKNFDVSPSSSLDVTVLMLDVPKPACTLIPDSIEIRTSSPTYPIPKDPRIRNDGPSIACWTGHRLIQKTVA
jgi:hypothetical protein